MELSSPQLREDFAIPSAVDRSGEPVDVGQILLGINASPESSGPALDALRSFFLRAANPSSAHRQPEFSPDFLMGAKQIHNRLVALVDFDDSGIWPVHLLKVVPSPLPQLFPHYFVMH
jgi:hypothetical protein